ncbi:unnamed protein product [Caenorhabditis brenneri]
MDWMENDDDDDWIRDGSGWTGWRTTTTTIGSWMARDGEQRRQRLDYGWLGMDWMENDDDNDWIMDGSGWKENNDDNDWIMDGSGWTGWRTTTTTIGSWMARDGRRTTTTTIGSWMARDGRRTTTTTIGLWMARDGRRRTTTTTGSWMARDGRRTTTTTIGLWMARDGLDGERQRLDYGWLGMDWMENDDDNDWIMDGSGWIGSRTTTTTTGLGMARDGLDGERRRQRLNHGWLGMDWMENDDDNDWIRDGSGWIGWRTTTTTTGLGMARDGLDGERRRQRLDHGWLGMVGEQRRQRLDYGWLGMDWIENDDDNDWIRDGSGWTGWRTTTTTIGSWMARDGLDGERQRLDYGWLGMDWMENDDDNDWIMDGSGWRTTTTTIGLWMARDGRRRTITTTGSWMARDGRRTTKTTTGSYVTRDGRTMKSTIDSERLGMEATKFSAIPLTLLNVFY